MRRQLLDHPGERRSHQVVACALGQFAAMGAVGAVVPQLDLVLGIPAAVIAHHRHHRQPGALDKRTQAIDKRPVDEAPTTPATRRWLFAQSFFGNFLFSICMLYGVSLTSAVAAGLVMSTIPAVVAVLMGLITGVFGGVLRDMVCNEIPTAFKDHRPYAVCAFAGGWTYVGLWSTDAPGWVALLGCVVVTVGLRGLALWRNWQLPAWRA